MGRRHLRLMRGVCRILGHRWRWRLSRTTGHVRCSRCGSGWQAGQPITPEMSVQRLARFSDRSSACPGRHGVTRSTSRATRPRTRSMPAGVLKPAYSGHWNTSTASSSSATTCSNSTGSVATPSCTAALVLVEDETRDTTAGGRRAYVEERDVGRGAAQAGRLPVAEGQAGRAVEEVVGVAVAVHEHRGLGAQPFSKGNARSDESEHGGQTGPEGRHTLEVRLVQGAQQRVVARPVARWQRHGVQVGERAAQPPPVVVAPGIGRTGDTRVLEQQRHLGPGGGDVEQRRCAHGHVRRQVAVEAKLAIRPVGGRDLEVPGHTDRGRGSARPRRTRR